MLLTSQQLKALNTPSGFYFTIQPLTGGFAAAFFPTTASLDDVRAVRAEGSSPTEAVKAAVVKTRAKWPELCHDADAALALPENPGLLEQAEEIVRYNS